MSLTPEQSRAVRGWGATTQYVSEVRLFGTTNATNFRKAVDMTDDELAAIVGRAKLTVVK